MFKKQGNVEKKFGQVEKKFGQGENKFGQGENKFGQGKNSFFTNKNIKNGFLFFSANKNHVRTEKKNELIATT